jgi:hypothetical protein
MTTSLRKDVAIAESIQHTVHMATESIQTCLHATDRVERWQHVASLFGLPLTTGQLDDLATLDDRTAAARFLPHLHDVERDEVLWAVGRA